MKNILKRVISFIIAILLFAFCSLSVYASDHGGGGASSSTRTLIKAQESKENREKIEDFIKQYFKDVSGFFVYAASQVGCVFTGQYKDAYESWLTMEDIINETGLYIDENGTPVDFYISTTLMKQIKQAIDDYAAENQPYYLFPTWKANQVPASVFVNKTAYKMFLDYASEHKITSFSRRNYGNKYFTLGDVTPIIKDGGGFISAGKTSTACYTINGNWDREMATYDAYLVGENSTDLPVVDSGKYSLYHTNDGEIHIYSDYSGGHLVTQDGGRIRVFKTETDFINYSVGQRKIYYTSNYYDYVPEDLSVSIDDLQKTIDDMQDVIDKLLDQITNDTSESEIEELLKKILEELQKNPGGSGSGSGGDVNVDIDLSTTNSWLSKIYTKVSQIFDKLPSDGSDSNIFQKGLDAVLSKLDELDATLKKYLSEITGDLDDIKGQLKNMSEEEFEEKSDSFLDNIMDLFSEIGEVAKTKFPFSIPNDLRIFISKIAPSSGDEEPQQYSIYTSSGIALYSGEQGGGGASRPGSGFVSMEHGGGGSSRDPVELKNDAPVFRLPIVIERYGIEEYIIIDMAPFDPLSRFSRGFFTILFMVCLFNLTFKVIGMWGDLIG